MGTCWWLFRGWPCGQGPLGRLPCDCHWSPAHKPQAAGRDNEKPAGAERQPLLFCSPCRLPSFLLGPLLQEPCCLPGITCLKLRSQDEVLKRAHQTVSRSQEITKLTNDGSFIGSVHQKAFFSPYSISFKSYPLHLFNLSQEHLGLVA